MRFGTSARTFPVLRPLWKNPIHDSSHLSVRAQRRIQVIKTIDAGGFKWSVWAVAATGFFTDSYNLFATNVVLPILLYVYWSQDEPGHVSIINLVTLAGSVVGQLLFGFLADNFGRQRLYGIELIVVIFTTIGVAQSASGFNGSMNILGWLCAWRFVMGVGIGAEYPLSATITAEWAPTKSRARMMAAVFIMQPLGQLAAALVGLWVAVGLHRGGNDISDKEVADQLWRYVTGVGAIPTVIALIFRLTIPESPRYTLDMQNDAEKARLEAETQYPPLDDDFGLELEEDGSHTDTQSENSVAPFSIQDVKQYFIKEGNWVYLAGTSLCWFLLDIAFYGLGIDNPRTLAKLWADDRTSLQPGIPSWASDSTQQDKGLYIALLENARNSILLVSIGSIIGSILMIWFIEYLPRRKVLIASFLWLALLLAGTGICFHFTFGTSSHGATITLFAICQASFNFGPNTLTFIIPAEIFPTRYRCTCHGISAAAGKLGSIVIQVIIMNASFGGKNFGDPDSDAIGWLMVVFAGVMALAAIVAWAWIPDVQNYHSRNGLKLPSKGLEELAEGRRRAEEGQRLGLRIRKRIHDA